MCAGNSKWISHRPENVSVSWNNKINRFLDSENKSVSWNNKIKRFLGSENKSVSWNNKINRFLYSLLPTINSGNELINSETIQLLSGKKTTDCNYKLGGRTLRFNSWRKALTD